jgi:hypothetical protein
MVQESLKSFLDKLVSQKLAFCSQFKAPLFESQGSMLRIATQLRMYMDMPCPGGVCPRWVFEIL